MKYITGYKKLWLYLRIITCVPFYYLGKVPLKKYPGFLWRALILLKAFWHNKAVKVQNGYKLHLYLPAYLGKAFFWALESKLLREPPGPVSIVYSMTKACDFKCPHCYQHNDAGKDMPQELLNATALQLRDKGVAMFDIEGGEPFLKFNRLLNLVKVFDERSEVWVNTHGKHVTEEKLLQLQQNGLFGIMVSLHSTKPEEHDKFTGIPDSWKGATNAIKLANEIGLVTAINCVLVAEQVTKGELANMMNLGKKLNVDFIQLIHPKPSGLWLQSAKEIEMNEQFIKEIEKAHYFYNARKCKTLPSLAAQVAEENEQGFGCTAGAIDRFYVNATGEVQPCEFLNISFGNVQTEDFDTIYDRMRQNFPHPGDKWLCCTMAESINQTMMENGLTQTPIPWKYTEELMKSCEHGNQAKVYRNLGIYKASDKC